MQSQIGYNFFMKLNGKKVAGVTQDDFNVSAKVVDSITKDDAGAMQSTVAHNRHNRCYELYNLFLYVYFLVNHCCTACLC